MSYDRCSDMITYSMMMNQEIQSDGKEPISKITGRSCSEYSKDV